MCRGRRCGRGGVNGWQVTRSGDVTRSLSPAVSVKLPRMFSWSAAAGEAWVPLVLTAVGLVMAAWARRGWRIGDHPTCRRCDFDLFGNAAADRCPECGADLTRRRSHLIPGIQRARAVGIRQVRHGWWWAGTSGAVVCGLWAGSVFIMSFAGLRAVQLKPTPLLVHDLGASGDRQVAAWQQLERRAMEGELSPEQRVAVVEAVTSSLPRSRRLDVERVDGFVRRAHGDLPAEASLDLASYWQALAEVARHTEDSRRADAAGRLLDWYDRGALAGGAEEVPVELFVGLADAVLAIQADPEAEWSPVLGDTLMVAYLHGRIAPEVIERYARHSVRIEVDVRPNLRSGDLLPFTYRATIRSHSPAEARPGNPPWTPRISAVALTLDGGENLVAEIPNLRDPLPTMRALSRLELDADRLPEPGPKNASLTFQVEVGVPGHRPVAAWEETHAADLELVAAEASSVELVRDLDLAGSRGAHPRALRPQRRRRPQGPASAGGDGQRADFSRPGGTADLARLRGSPGHAGVRHLPSRPGERPDVGAG